MGGGDAVIRGVPVVTTLYASAGAISDGWVATATADTTYDALTVVVQNPAGTQIYWHADITGRLVKG